MLKMIKAEVPAGYPPEEGCYLVGNPNSPVAVVVLLNYKREEMPPEIEQLVRLGIESGAALSGTLQTENVGLEKVICNVVANPNIRYLIVFGPESPGHSTGDAIRALYENGVDETDKMRRIIGTKAPAPNLPNIPQEAIDRFREQTRLVNLVNEGSPDLLKDAIVACYQEKPTRFGDYELWDMGAYEGEPICSSITWNIRNPTYPPPTDPEEQKAVERMNQLTEKLRKRGKNGE